MIPIKYVVGDATAPQGDGPKIITHIVNDVGIWRRGFVLALSKRWPWPERGYDMWAKGNATIPFVLGHVQIVDIEPGLWVANMLAQHDRHTIAGCAPIRYMALKECLGHVAASALSRKASVHMPRIGCGLAGGSWDMVGPIVKETLSDLDIPVTVYDLTS